MDLNQPIAMPPLVTTGLTFHPVIQLPDHYDVYDFTDGYDPDRMRSSTYGIGRYNERRPTMYNAPQYAVGEIRNIHMGIDIAAPVGVAVRAFYKGTIYRFNLAIRIITPTMNILLNIDGTVVI